MRIHWSPRSPYVRKAMVALHEKGLADRVAAVRTQADPMIPHEGLMKINPLSKIPTLETGDGTLLFDSHVICRWADDTGRCGPRLFPAGLVAERDAALGTGMLDTALPLLVETQLRPVPERSAQLTAALRHKLRAATDWLEAHVPALRARPFDIGHLSIGVALCYLDFRFGAEDWRAGRPWLADWHAGIAARPSFRATGFRDDPRPQT